MPSDTFSITQQHISSTTQCPRVETKYFLREMKFMGVVNVESCGNRDSHILCMDEPYVVKMTCGLLDFSWLILCWNLRHEILPKKLLRSFSLGVFPIFTQPLFSVRLVWLLLHLRWRDLWFETPRNTSASILEYSTISLH